ncbi:hypothetical protein CHLNCDRAFT_132936 [Chlorella variabilis]|uniref:Bifunctional inhibitor/plant lipid transfer protein/seed storage helical domain-containing protein n=1 Tax=Chlorella variabilis TaxID=554065 RepID=E1Z1Z6_CHLVA|nr:hypothetical protein CHLNCDRAFT_132936 [Chlorella variabilis]EFN59577.1 hypothetical protein CHLNCDRAFT_132936 [Chlorella variabilis]|eukprot:XP_005851679.1 hypothetical protein CHLNCDRAFT_132936 [Chlorella variabilis]
MASFAHLLLLLLGVASVAAQNRIQTCIPLGGPMLNACSAELEYLNQPDQFPLTSTSPPDDAKVQSVISGLPAGLPSAPCCAAVQKFDTAGCGCESSLSQTLKAVGIQSEPAGLAGVVKIAGTACKFQPFQCQ